ncbi:MAG: distal tail protein Dit [Syntrophomonas sp.]
MSGLTFNGVHSATFGLGVRVYRPLLPGTSDNYVDIPGRAGSILYPGKPKDRLIPVEFGFMPGSRALFRSRVWEISAWLGTEERKILIIDDEPDKIYIAKPEGQVDLEQAFLLGKFTVVFRAEPYTYGSEQNQAFVNDAAAITNSGTVETPPRLSVIFTAAAAEWKAALVTGEYIRIVHNFVATDTLEIDCKTGAIYHNGTRAMNLLDWQNSILFSLAKGENTLAITPTGKCNAIIYWTPRYL